MRIQLQERLSRCGAAIRRFWQHSPRITTTLVAAVAILTVSVALVLNTPTPPPEETPALPSTPVVPDEDVFHAPGTLDAKLAALKKLALADDHIDDTLKKSMGYYNEKAPFAVFFSASDGDTRAMVVSGSGTSVAEAWLAAESALRAYAQGEHGKVVWLKVDVVNHMERLDTEDLSSRLADCRENGFRQGIALDDAFETALLEAELNAGNMIDYEADELDLPNANVYLANADRDGISMLPETVLLFTTQGYMCDETDTAYALAGDGMFYGQQMPDKVDKDDALAVMKTAAKYLTDSLQDNGQFEYCYYPSANRRSTGYNIMRHCGAIWSLCEQQALSDTLSLQLSVDQAIAYLETQIQIQDDRAFVCQTGETEIRLGSNAMAVVALSTYAEVYDTTQYDTLITQLADGILFMQTGEDGGFTHVWNADDLTAKTESYSAYYDGQATCALAKAYGRTKESRFMTGMKQAADGMVAHHDEERIDQWVAYAMNEVTRYLPEEAYFNLGLQTALDHLSSLQNYTSSAPYALELLMNTYEMVERMEENAYHPDLLKTVDKAALTAAIEERSKRTLVGYFAPETAMYMEYPQRVLGTFYLREDRFRIRLDDLQQGICGYAAFAQMNDQGNEAKG